MGHNFKLNYIRKSSNDFFLEPLMGIWPNSTGMVPGWSPTKIVQMVLIGCISRARGQKLSFQNAISKNLLVWKYKAESIHIWCITSSRAPLPIFGGPHKWSSVNGSTVTFSSGERPRALKALLVGVIAHCLFFILLTLYRLLLLTVSKLLT